MSFFCSNSISRLSCSHLFLLKEFTCVSRLCISLYRFRIRSSDCFYFYFSLSLSIISFSIQTSCLKTIKYTISARYSYFFLPFNLLNVQTVSDTILLTLLSNLSLFSFDNKIPLEKKRQNMLVVKSTFRSSTGILGSSVSLPSEQT